MKVASEARVLLPVRNGGEGGDSLADHNLGRHCCKPQTAFLSLSVHSRRDAAENAPITSGWDRIICFHEV
jgi:hypothetical protein